MKTIIVFTGVWMAIVLVSCQKQLSLPHDPAPPEDTIQAPLPVFTVTDIWRYDYDSMGVAIADSEHIHFEYDSTAPLRTITGEYRDAVNGNFNYKHVYYYDNNNNWQEDDEYNPNDFTAIKYSNLFYRDGNGDAMRFEYAKDDYSGNPRRFMARFQYRNLGNGNREVTVADSFYYDYPLTSYYKVQQDASGKPVRREFLTWSWNPNTRTEMYSYDAGGQLQKVVDSAVFNSPPAPPVIPVTTVTYTQDPAANGTLDKFTKELNGRNFWWYVQGVSYSYHLLYDPWYVGKPLKSISSTTKVFQNGTLISTVQNNYTFNNTFDLDRNLSGFAYLRNGKKLHQYKFAYKQVK